MKQVNFRMVGSAPLLQHNERLSDPLSAWAKKLKQLSGKRKKTDEDIEAIRFAEWCGGLYLSPDEKDVIVPVDWVLAATLAGAKKSKCGPSVKAGVFEIEPAFRLRFDDDQKPPQELYSLGDKYVDYRGVAVNRARVMRCRPRFPNWSLEASLQYDPDCIDRKDLLHHLSVAGAYIGIGDYRPRFGRFTVEEL